MVGQMTPRVVATACDQVQRVCESYYLGFLSREEIQPLVCLLHTLMEPRRPVIDCVAEEWADFPPHHEPAA